MLHECCIVFTANGGQLTREMQVYQTFAISTKLLYQVNLQWILVLTMVVKVANGNHARRWYWKQLGDDLLHKWWTPREPLKIHWYAVIVYLTPIYAQCKLETFRMSINDGVHNIKCLCCKTNGKKKETNRLNQDNSWFINVLVVLDSNTCHWLWH